MVCKLCNQTIVGVRYNCEQCICDYCQRCWQLDDPAHVLRAVRQCPPDWDDGGEDGFGLFGFLEWRLRNANLELLVDWLDVRHGHGELRFQPTWEPLQNLNQEAAMKFKEGHTKNGIPIQGINTSICKH